MHIIIGALLIALLLLGCRVLWYAAICMRPRVQEVRAQQQRARELQQTPHQRPSSISAFVLPLVLFVAAPILLALLLFPAR